MICREADIPLLLPAITSYLGMVYAMADRMSEALVLQEQEEASQHAEKAMMQVFLGEIYLLSNRLEDARDCANQALMFARAHDERGYQAWGLRLYGAVLHRNALEIDQAEIHYKQSLTLATELGMRPLQAHCHRGLGALYRQTDQFDKARVELSTAIEMYRDMEMTFWLPETEAALAEMGRRDGIL